MLRHLVPRPHLGRLAAGLGGMVLALGGLLPAAWAQGIQEVSYAMPLALPQSSMPSFAGLVEGKYVLGVMHRERTATDNRTFRQTGVTAGLPLRFNWMEGGVGLLASTDERAGLRTTEARLALAYEVPLGLKVRYDHVRAGFEAGYTQRTFGQETYIFADEFNGLGFDPGTTSESFQSFTSHNLDLRVSLLWYRTQKIKGNLELNPYLGFSMGHLNRPVVSFQGGDQPVPLGFRYRALGGARLRTRSPWEATVTGQFQQYNNLWAVSASAAVEYIFYENGLWFGTEKAALRAGLTYNHGRTMAVFLGVRYDRAYTFGFGYDVRLADDVAAQTRYAGLQVMFAYTPPLLKRPSPTAVTGSALPFPLF